MILSQSVVNDIVSFPVFAYNLYRPTQPYAGFQNMLMNSLAYHMLVFVCLLGNNLSVHVKLEELRPLCNIFGI